MKDPTQFSQIIKNNTSPPSVYETVTLSLSTFALV